ncbi:tail assembly protein [Burkholderia phage vB_BceS_AH2]|uniref:Tail assembly protein n=1 Tax=Burkholderia phage vB_BceS_AH2 TaxID=1133022 RepID=I6NSS3_9CAUD|nr:tail assembly chaperone [Burkholderia phage vB_BceS_AH2]AEY69556.1 tail assembly protein [Burkholderia phage vB_BceS_AH2]
MWIQLIIALVMLVISYLIMPKPKRNDPTVQALKDDDFPLADEGNEIPVVFGECVLAAPNVVWWGDVKTREIRSSGGKK